MCRREKELEEVLIYYVLGIKLALYLYIVILLVVLLFNF